jgi:hypothetical protein
MKKRFLTVTIAFVCGILLTSTAFAVTLDVSTSTKTALFSSNATKVTSSLFTTASTNELLLAIISQANNGATSTQTLAA